MKNSPEDYLLIDKFLSGEEEGFETLVKKYQNYIVNIVYSLIGQNSYVEDIAQEVFIKVYKNLSSFKKKCAFSTWLYRITVNTTYNYVKGKKENISFDSAGIDFCANTNINAEIESKEKDQIIQKAIENLPFKYRTVVVFKDIQGFSYAEIAKILGCRIGTVESRLFRARAILKERLSPLLLNKDIK